jgi:hypothetical protein
MSEVSSGNPQTKPHPAGPSALAQKMYAVKLVVVEVGKTAAVSTFSLLFILLQNIYILHSH